MHQCDSRCAAVPLRVWRNHSDSSGPTPAKVVHSSSRARTDNVRSEEKRGKGASRSRERRRSETTRRSSQADRIVGQSACHIRTRKDDPREECQLRLPARLAIQELPPADWPPRVVHAAIFLIESRRTPAGRMQLTRALICPKT